MGESDRYLDYKKFSSKKFTLGQAGNALFALFVANIIFFFIILFSKVFYLFTHQGIGNAPSNFDGLIWFALPANLNTLIYHPWTVFTFMFSMGGQDALPLIVSMISSMLWLWAFAYILQDLSGNRYIFPIYIYGSLIGAVFFLLATNVIHPLLINNKNLFLYGAQTGTAAIATAITTLNPMYRLFRHLGKGIPLWVLTTIYFLINLLTIFSLSDANSFAIIGGGLAGYVFVYLLKREKDCSIWMHQFYNWLSNLYSPKMVNKKEKIFYNTGKIKPFNKYPNVTQQRVDEILDKISLHGYQYLTDDEKNILKRAGNQDM